VGIGLYTYDLALLLKKEGHQVTVLTTFPYYPWWETPENLKSFAVEYSSVDGIHVYRSGLKFWKSNTTFARIRFEIEMWLGLRKVYTNIKDEKFDKVISVIPSLGAGLLGKTVSSKTNAPHYLIIQDITTNGVSESGMSFGSLLKHLILPVERIIIRSARSVGVISQSMVLPVKKISGNVIPIVHLANYETGSDEPRLKFDRKDFHLPADKFIILHAGSIAKKQNLETLVEASILLHTTNVQIYLFGHGNAEEDILKSAEGVDNFFIRPSVPKDRFKSLLKCADLLIVNERPSQLSMALPSKLISYFSSGVPVLAAVPRGGATYEAIKGLAFWTEAGNSIKLAESIRTIMESRTERKIHAENARRFYENELVAEVGQRRYLEWLFG
jgi:glycosyltransferase involved in cell wall biosynthesis